MARLFLVPRGLRGLRILQNFAGFCRLKPFSFFVYSRQFRTHNLVTFRVLNFQLLTRDNPVEESVVLKRSLMSGRKWWVRSDSNREPNDYEPFALTIELRTLPHIDYQLRRSRRTICSFLLPVFLGLHRRYELKSRDFLLVLRKRERGCRVGLPWD
jgi:hypothetical protein